MQQNDGTENPTMTEETQPDQDEVRKYDSRAAADITVIIDPSDGYFLDEVINSLFYET